MVAPLTRKSGGQVLVILVTAETQEEAVRIGEKMVHAKLAACANIIPGIQSIYRWKGKVAKAQEVLLILKCSNLGIVRLKKRSRRCMPMKFLKLLRCRLRMVLSHTFGGCVARPTAKCLVSVGIHENKG